MWERERRFQEMIDALPAAIYTTDAAGRVTHYNRAAVEMTGRTPQIGTDQWCVTLKLYHPDGTPMPHDSCPMAVALKENRSVRGVEIIAERPDGTHIWCEPYPTPLRDGQGRVTGGINMLLDITERKQADEIRARLAAIVESSDDAIISKDLNGIIRTWNSGAQRLFGYTAQEAIGQPVTMLMPADRYDEEKRILERIRRGERIDHYETVRRRKDGSLLDISLTVSPLVDVNGRIVGASKIARDITERKQAEAASKEAERRKDEFLAMLAHELRNPLAPIRNALEVLRLRGGDGRAVEAMREMMERQFGQLVRLVDDLLDVSRLSRGRVELRKSRVDLLVVVDLAVEAARSAFECKGQELTLVLPEQAVCVDGDVVRLTQVLGNLLNNASRFTARSGRATLTLEPLGQEAVLRVRDNGIGIAAADLTRIFELFTQVDTTLGRSQSGLGIGLNLVKTLVELHGGRVEAHSAGVGQGSEFTVHLPLAGGAPGSIPLGAVPSRPFADPLQ